MDTIGLDLHKRETQLCILTDDGELVDRRIVTTRERLVVANPATLSAFKRKSRLLTGHD
jgi:hypothetical protein